MRHHCACKKQQSYSTNGEEFWPLGVSHIEQHIKFAQLEGYRGYEMTYSLKKKTALLKVWARAYRPAGISVVATGFKFAFCNTAFALARSLF